MGMTYKNLDKAKKNAKIKESMKATRKKRASQHCAVITLKVNAKKLSEEQRETLKMMFVEAKWLRNHILNWANDNPENKIWKYDGGLETVRVKTKDGTFEERDLKYLGMQMRQSVEAELVANVRALAKLKTKGRKIGGLKYVSEVNSLNLKQHGMSHKFKGAHRMKIQNVPGTLYVSGTKQLSEGMEIANAKLLKKPDGYYIALTVYMSGQSREDSHARPEVGVDFGRQTSFTLSTGEKIDVHVGESERLKRLQRKLARQEKRSNNWWKTKRLIDIEYQKITNRRDDAGNKAAAYLLSHEKVYMQDEQLRSWHKKRVQDSCLGRVKAKLVRHPRVVVLHCGVPTTKSCECGHKQDMKLWDRTFKCDKCGHTEDRDVHAAKNMIRLAKEAEESHPEGRHAQGS